MNQAVDISDYTTELSDGMIRPLTVQELVSRLEQMMLLDQSIAEMPVGLSVDSEGNGIYVPRVFEPREFKDGNPVDDVVGIVSAEDCACYGVPECVLIG